MATDGTPHSSGAPENEVNDDQQEPGPLVNAQQVLDPHEPTPSTPEVSTHNEFDVCYIIHNVNDKWYVLHIILT